MRLSEGRSSVDPLKVLFPAFPPDSHNHVVSPVKHDAGPTPKNYGRSSRKNSIINNIIIITATTSIVLLLLLLLCNVLRFFTKDYDYYYY